MNSIVFKKTRNYIMNSIVFEKNHDFLFQFCEIVYFYCIVLIENNFKKHCKNNNTIQHNNTIQFGKTYYCIVLCCFRNNLKKQKKKQ